MTATTNAPAQTLTMQGIEVPSASVNPQLFMQATRRLRFAQASVASIQGFGQTDTFQIKQTGIIAAIDITVKGTIVVALGATPGTCASTARWPFDLLSRVRLSANGQSNLINCSGAKLRVHEFMAIGDTSDRGIPQSVGGATIYQGTLSQNSDEWGVGQSQSGIASGTYDVAFTVRIPVAFDQTKLTGAIFAQTASTSLQVDIDWAPESTLFTLADGATVTQNLSCELGGVVYSIPESNGEIVVPDLSVFHSLVQNNDFTLGSGAESQLTLQGQGVGRQLMRTYWQVWNGAAPQAPLVINDANFGSIGWRYGGNDTPEVYSSGRVLRAIQEKLYDTDIGLQGFASLDWCSQWAFRDSIDEGTATNLRLLITCNAATTSPRTEIVQETIFSGASGS